jgi:hypothetical protein
MTTPELIQLFLFATRFRASLRNQFGNWIAALRRLAKPAAHSFEGRQRSLEHESVVLDAGDERIPLAEAKLLSHLRWDHNAPLSIESDLWHQGQNVPELKRNGNESVTLVKLHLSGQSGPPHVDSIAAEGDSLGHEPAPLADALGEGAVGADDAPPGQVRVIALEEDGASETGGGGRDVAVGADEAGWDLAHAGEDFEQAGLVRCRQLAGPKASMMRFWYSESSSGEMK